MELRHLRCFVAVAEDLNFRKAAQRLHVAQPALSRTIKHLEEEAGVTLLARNQRSVELTSAGRSLLGDARRLLQEAQTAVIRARGCAHAVRATLRVGISESFDETPLMRRALPAFRRQFPEVKLELHELFSILQVEAIRKHDLDAGIMFHAAPDRSLIIVPLEELEACVAVPTSDPLAKKTSVHLKELAGRPFIMFPRRWWPALYDRHLELARQAGFEMHISEETGRMDTGMRRVAAGAGVMITLGHVAQRKTPGVACLKLRDWPLTYQSNLVWRRDDTSPLLAAFVKRLLPGNLGTRARSPATN
jgi:DNA-binding transcriptional LysR family regulator